jgi:hypothetical protein
MAVTWRMRLDLSMTLGGTEARNLVKSVPVDMVNMWRKRMDGSNLLCSLHLQQ